jgi:hypothetical protein
MQSKNIKNLKKRPRENMNKETLTLGIKKLRTVGFPGQHKFSAEKTKAWFEALNDLNDDQFLDSINDIIRTDKFFPTIADIRERALKRDIKLSSEAWAEVLGEMERVCGTGNRPSFSTPLIERSVRSIGGLDTIWKAGADQETYYRLNFIKAYDAMAKREQRDDVLGLPTKEDATKILENFGLKMKDIP